MTKSELFEQLRTYMISIKENAEESEDICMKQWINPLCREANKIIDKLEKTYND